MLLLLFELHPSNHFRENRCWNDEYSFLNRIDAKLSDRRNSKHAGHFKFTKQHLAWFWTAVGCRGKRMGECNLRIAGKVYKPFCGKQNLRVDKPGYYFVIFKCENIIFTCENIVSYFHMWKYNSHVNVCSLRTVKIFDHTQLDMTLKTTE